MIYAVIISRPGINSPANTVETCQTHAKHTAEFQYGGGDYRYPLLFATASFPCRGSLIIRRTRSRNKRGREREREMNGKIKKNNESGGNFSVNRYITR